MQGQLMLADSGDEGGAAEGLMNGASVVYSCGGSTGKLPICLSRNGWMDAAKLEGWIQQKSELVLVDSQFLRDSYRFVDEFELSANVLVLEQWSQPVNLKQIGLWPASPPIANRWWRQHRRTLFGLVIEISAKIWGVSVDDILLVSDFSYGDNWVWRKIGTTAH